MGEIGGMEFGDLAAAIASVNWDVSLSYDLLKAIMLCLQSDGDLDGSSANSTFPAQYYAAGLDAYKTRLPYGLEDLSKSDLCVAFLMFMGLVISSSRGPAFSRLVVVELDLVTVMFMTQMYPGLLKPKMPSSRELLQSELVLSVLLKKLDPGNDYFPVTRLNKVLSLTTTNVASPLSNELSTTSESDLLASIRSHIAYLQNANHRLAQAEAVLGPNSHSRIPSYSHLKSVYGDILELSRPAYSLSIRTQAFRLIMGEVGGMEFEDLAAAMVNWDVSLSHDLLKAIMLCSQSEGILEDQLQAILYQHNTILQDWMPTEPDYHIDREIYRNLTSVSHS
ncbi:hypothetical protein BT96DRAFT_979948 [Gymnopus androsaceus JB14]|uniref:Uncharacterized protein n=1 Tax=Gymnopus androsaceus JB14 TaxID=1447944 RepID=A0A6A4H1F0_9AGAR|nr:hypothetical protein BT96DRAFT_979948 [Gymnopus androsaceus JB14]